MRTHFLPITICLCADSLLAAVGILPTPHYSEPLTTSISLARGSTCTILVGPAQNARSEKALLAAEAVRRELQAVDSSLRVEVRAFGESAAGTRIYLWNYGADARPSVALNLLDRETLAAPGAAGQSYVIRTPDAGSLWVVGAGEQGVLWGAMTVLQLIHAEPQGVSISGVYVRDRPDFEFRAASDWLLNVEGNRWALDRGQGVEAYVRVCEQKLDRALRYKINLVLFDGFGWGLDQRFAGYPAMMRRLNRYARARGIHLLFGGYGASYGMAYQHGPLYEEGAYLGKVFENREHYPDGPIYRCMGFPSGRKGVDPATLGSCRGNDDLNRLKAEELHRFVEAVHPGALYIHHEDFGGFGGTQKVWLERCPRCRKRWPNDSLAAPDGGAGALANGYSALVRAVTSVKDPADGYDAARDCQIILVSPVYIPNTPESDDWSRVMELWRNVAGKLPRGDNVQVCFREVFPQRYGGAKWTDGFNAMMRRAGLNLGIFMFLAGGADNYLNDYPYTATAALNAMFQGARSMYNFDGDFYQEPTEIVNAEYTWNARSGGFYNDPRTFDDATAARRRLMQDEDMPREMQALYKDVCNRLYGAQAGPVMNEYYTAFKSIPDVPDRQKSPNGRYSEYTYLPMTFNHAYGVPEHWRHLGLDSKTWGAEITNEAYVTSMQKLEISRQELHRRQAHRWGIVAEMNRKGAGYIDQALAASPLPQSIDDLRFLQTSFRVYQPLLEALQQFHTALDLHFGGKNGAEMKSALQAALVKAKDAQGLADQSFPQPLDPVGGEVGALRKHAHRLVESIEMWIAKS